MPSCMSKYRFVRVRISILSSKIISGNLEAAGGWSWRLAMYRYGDQTLLCLHVCLNIGFFRVRISILTSKIISLGGCWRLILEASQVQIWSYICLHVSLNIGFLDIHEGILSLISISVPSPPPGSAPSGLKWPDIIFDERIDILTLKNLYLDIH